MVLALLAHWLYAKAEKCMFYVRELLFFVYWIGPKGVGNPTIRLSRWYKSSAGSSGLIAIASRMTGHSFSAGWRTARDLCATLSGLTPFECALGRQLPLCPWDAEPTDLPGVVRGSGGQSRYGRQHTQLSPKRFKGRAE